MLNKTKFLSILIILLLIVNTATLVLFWMQKNKHPEPPKQGGAFQFLIKELNLTREQQDKFEMLRNTHRAKMDSLNQVLKLQKDSLFEGLKKPQNSLATKAYHLAKISVLTTQIDSEVFDHFTQVRAFCTTEQQVKFDNVIKEAIRMPKRPSGPPKPDQKPYPESRIPHEDGDRPPPPNEGELK